MLGDRRGRSVDLSRGTRARHPQPHRRWDRKTRPLPADGRSDAREARGAW